MPRFSENEKERIRQCLIDEGEKLFVKYGLKKVTIDDIVDAVKIAKASFYKFYEGKEYLFLDIAQERQKEIFDKLTVVLDSSKNKPDRERVKLVFYNMSLLMRSYPLLTMIDKDIVEIIMRKVDMERLGAFSAQGVNAVQLMIDKGIKFKVTADVASMLFQALYQSYISVANQPPEMQKQVIDIMLEGILNQIVKE